MTQPSETVVALFEACLGVADDQRAGLLDSRCGDDAGLRSAVEELLAADQVSDADRFLEWADPATEAQRSPENSPFLGARLGPYQVIERVAAGAMGVVYRAERIEGFAQEVAVKVLRPWLCDDEGVARFHAEQQALADLPHPNIARLLDAGVTSDGSHYLVMELIDGHRLDEAVSALQPSLDTKLRWFLTLCRAIAFAHGRGIAHRDLKPANVLMQREKAATTQYDGEQLVPKITDFGLAKIASADGGGLTATGEVLGTPGYMAPEQIRGDRGQVGFSTDIYGLGAVLYFLLTGKPPFRGGSITELLRELEHADPEPPASLERSLPKDLNTVCLKCLEKQPSARYATALEVGDDVQRYLAGFPVKARPVGSVVRTLRWANRNRSLAALAASLIAVLLTALAITTSLFVVAERRRAELEVERESALDTIDKLMTDLSKTLQTQPATDEVRQALLTAAKSAYDARLGIRHADPRRVQVEAATAAYRLAQIRYQSLQYDEGRRIAEEALQRFRRLAVEYPESHQFQFDVFHCLLLMRDYDAAFEQIARLAESHPLPDYLAAKSTVYYQRGALLRASDLEQSKELFESGLDIDRSILSQFPDEPRYQRSFAKGLCSLAAVQRAEGNHAAALLLMNEAIPTQKSLVADEPSVLAFRKDLAETLRNAGVSHIWLGQHEAGHELLAEAGVVANEVTRWSPTHPLAWWLRMWTLQIAVDSYSTAAIHTDDFADLVSQLDRALSASHVLIPQSESRLSLLRAAFLADCPLANHRDLTEASRMTESLTNYDEIHMAHLFLGIVRLREGDLDKARAFFAKTYVVSGKVDSPHWLYPALALATNGDFTLADRALETLKPWKGTQLYDRLSREISVARAEF